MKKLDFVRTGAGNYYGAKLRDSAYGEFGLGICGDSAELNALAFNAITGAGFINSEQRENKLASTIKSLFNNPESAKIKEMSKRAERRLEKFKALSAGVIASGSSSQNAKEREQI